MSSEMNGLPLCAIDGNLKEFLFCSSPNPYPHLRNFRTPPPFCRRTMVMARPLTLHREYHGYPSFSSAEMSIPNEATKPRKITVETSLPPPPAVTNGRIPHQCHQSQHCETFLPPSPAVVTNRYTLASIMLLYNIHN